MWTRCQSKQMPKYIIKDIESYCDEYDTGPDEENSSKENSMRKILMKKNRIMILPQ